MKLHEHLPQDHRLGRVYRHARGSDGCAASGVRRRADTSFVVGVMLMTFGAYGTVGGAAAFGTGAADAPGLGGEPTRVRPRSAPGAR